MSAPDFGCEFCPGGDLYEQMQMKGVFTLEDAKFYSAEVVQVTRFCLVLSRSGRFFGAVSMLIDS